MVTLSDLKEEFGRCVNTTHIKYSWDAGHAYSYIDHPIMDVNVDHLTQDERDQWEEFTNEWLYANDECPPCQIDVKDGKVGSGCGCHDGLSLEEDKEEVEAIIDKLMTHQDNQ